MTLLGGRDLERGEMLPEEVAAKWLPGCKVVGEWPLTSFAAIMNTFEYMSPLKQEGYVVVDAAFRRVKVKHPGYVALHHAKGGLSRKAFVEIARKGEVSRLVPVPQKLHKLVYMHLPHIGINAIHLLRPFRV